jgi:hypothetical protein
MNYTWQPSEYAEANVYQDIYNQVIVNATHFGKCRLLTCATPTNSIPEQDKLSRMNRIYLENNAQQNTERGGRIILINSI